MSDGPKWHSYSADRGGRGWLTRGVWLHGPRTEASAEWSLLGDGFGAGVTVGRNGSESDIGLDLYAGPLGSLWLRLRSPLTKRLRARPSTTDRYQPRHYGIRVHPYDGCWLRLQAGAYDGMGRDAGRWREVSISTRTFLGSTSSTRAEGARGVTAIAMPEGQYAATWVEVTHVNRYTAPLGRLRDRLFGPRRHSYVSLDIPGGIPVEGKGENSWDCGMDGLFGCGGTTLAEAVDNCVRAVHRDRQRHGGPHGLTRPTTVAELSRP